MPANTFTSYLNTRSAKPDIEIDGDLVLVGSDGYTVSTTSGDGYYPSPYSHIYSVARSGVGVWKVTLKEAVHKVLSYDIQVETTVANYRTVARQPTTVNATTGRQELNFTFHIAGTATELPANAQFRVFAVVQFGSL
jgi:hypothetical protein